MRYGLSMFEGFEDPGPSALLSWRFLGISAQAAHADSRGVLLRIPHHSKHRSQCTFRPTNRSSEKKLAAEGGDGRMPCLGRAPLYQIR